ncbi:hypothetical protein ACXYMX_09315 [Sporosarcina sp. CAU 1771]
MTNDDRKEIVKKREMRTKEISNMIDEGGVGADKYYDIEKKPSKDSANSEKKADQKDKDDNK